MVPHLLPPGGKTRSERKRPLGCLRVALPFLSGPPTNQVGCMDVLVSLLTERRDAKALMKLLSEGNIVKMLQAAIAANPAHNCDLHEALPVSRSQFPAPCSPLPYSGESPIA